MSRLWLVVLGAVIGVLVLGGAVLALPVIVGRTTGPAALSPSSSPDVQTAATTPLSGTISVVGIGRASAVPDVTRMSVGVEVLAQTVGRAVGDTTSKQAAVIARLKSLGIADKDIQTVGFNVNVERRGDVVAGYRASSIAQITIRKNDQLAALLEAVVAAGANNIYGVGHGFSDTGPLTSEARAKAVADARAKAEALAQLAGLKVGRIISISEGALQARPVFEGGGGAGGFESGEEQLAVQVQVTFAAERQ